MFIGRTEELSKFNERYESDIADLVFLYGRRRVGKTEFLRKFAEGKPQVFFFSATESSDFEQREHFKSKLIADGFASLNLNGKSLVIIDEFQYMFNGNKSIPSILQNLWDDYLCKANFMLILCGSAMSYIENEVLGAKNPLYGRGTAIFKMKALSFAEAKLFFPDYSVEDQMIAYMILGGIPFYLKQFDSRKSLEINIKKNILSTETILYNEIEFHMKQQLRETAIYNTLISAIALGNTQLNQINQKTQIDKAKITTYISNLIDIDIVEREISVSDKIKETANVQRGLYKICDNYFRFWYRYVFPYKSEIESGSVDYFFKNTVEPDLNEFCGLAFESIAKQYLWRKNKEDKLPIHFSKCGRYWSKDCEIDILALSRKEIIFGECKWKNKVQGEKVYEDLVVKSKRFAEYEDRYFYIFSKSGFTQALKDIAANNNKIFLVGIDEMG